MSILAIRDALRDQLATIELLEHVLTHEPTAIEAAPMAYLLFDGSSISVVGQKSTRRWRILCRAVFLWGENQAAEDQLFTVASEIVRVVEGDATLNRAIDSGRAAVTEQQGVFVQIGGVTYRALDSFIEALEKVPYGT